MYYIYTYILKVPLGYCNNSDLLMVSEKLAEELVQMFIFELNLKVSTR